MKAHGHQMVTFAILLKPHIAASIALEIHSSVGTASSQHTPIPLFISLKDGMEVFFNQPPSWTLVSSYILDMLVFSAPHNQINNILTL
jgi:hypothetical protein